MTTFSGRKVKVDATRCQGHGRCLGEAATIFGFTDDTNMAYILPTADIDAHQREIDYAIAACPEQALSWDQHE
jgi:ferredoxin